MNHRETLPSRGISRKDMLKRGEVPTVDSARLRTLRMLIHGELAGIVLILLFAAMMARGVGFSG